VINEQTRNEIVRRWAGGESMRSIARNLRISRLTVKRALRRHEQQRMTGTGDLPSPSSDSRRPSSLDSFEPTIRDLLARYPQITAVRMLEELRARGFEGAYTIVCDRLRQLRPQPVRKPVMRFETSPGAQAQMDYAVYNLDFTEEGRRRINLFSYLLSYSRRQYLRFVTSQDFETTIREHVRAFEHFGGVAATCLYDNFKVVVASYDGQQPIYNQRFLAFATHYGMRPWACRRRRPQTKGKVERQFHFIQNNLLNGRSFRSVDHLNEVTKWWLANVADVRIHRERKRRPIELFDEERPHLLPLPSQSYDVAQVVYRTVGADGFVSYGQNFYSVPWRYIGEVLAVRVTEDELIVYGPHLEKLTCHRLLPRTVTGQKCQQKGHGWSEGECKRLEILKERFAELGSVGTRFLEGLLQGRRYGKDEAQRVLALLGIYRREDLNRAMERAVRFGAFSLRAVERILAVAAQPKSGLEAMADDQHHRMDPRLDEKAIPPRDPGEYDQLFPEEPNDDDEPSDAPF